MCQICQSKLECKVITVSLSSSQFSMTLCSNCIKIVPIDTFLKAMNQETENK